MKKITHVIFLSVITISTLFLVFVISEAETPEEWSIEYGKLQKECEAQAPEGSVCLVDYFGEPPYSIMAFGFMILSCLAYFSCIYIERKENEEKEKLC